MTDPAPKMTEDAFRLIAGLIADYAGLYFPQERAQAVASKLAPRLQETGCPSYLDYYHLLKYDGGAEIFYAIERLTNHETYFFRETAQLQVIVQMAEQARTTLRVLSAGCSSGEEPYTLAMMLDQAGMRGRVEIIGIDISGGVLERAREATYAVNSFRGVEGPVVSAYFAPHDDRMRLSPRLKNSVTFHQMNLLDRQAIADLGTFDAVLCRNVLIHFSRESKCRAVAGLADTLPEGGYLFLGHSESLVDVPNDLDMIRTGSVIAHRRPSPRSGPGGGM